jgi:choline dehydrogenase-like flavoprotein
MPVQDALEADVIVVGSGPGGATLSRELAHKGKKVLLLERGIDHRPHRYYGTYLGALIYADRRSLLFTQEGLNIIRPLMVGGATSMYCGCAAPPPDWPPGQGVDIRRVKHWKNYRLPRSHRIYAVPHLPALLRLPRRWAMTGSPS